MSRDKGLKRAIAATGSISELARSLGITRAAISQWHRVPTERIIQVEHATGISREILRPDMYIYPKRGRNAVRSSRIARAG